MSIVARIRTMVTGLFKLFFGILLIYEAKEAYWIVTFIISLAFAFEGIKSLTYFFSMARFMVDGRTILYKGLILLDLGLFTMSIVDLPKYYVVLYLLVLHGFAGLVEILRAFEAKRYGGNWKLKFFHGIVDLVMAVACLVFIKYVNIVVMIYAVGLIYSALINIITVFRKTTFVYVR